MEEEWANRAEDEAAYDEQAAGQRYHDPLDDRFGGGRRALDDEDSEEEGMHSCSQSLPSEHRSPRRNKRKTGEDPQAVGWKRDEPRYSDPVGVHRQRVKANQQVPNDETEVTAKQEGYHRGIDPLRCLPVSRSSLLGTERPHMDDELRFDKIMGTRMIEGRVYSANLGSFNQGGGREGAVAAQEARHQARLEAGAKKPDAMHERIADAEDGCTAWVVLMASKVLKAIKPLKDLPIVDIAGAIIAAVEGKPATRDLTLTKLDMKLPLSKEVFPVRTCTLSTAQEANAGIELDGTVLRVDGGAGSFVRVPHANVVAGGVLRMSGELAPKQPPYAAATFAVVIDAAGVRVGKDEASLRSVEVTDPAPVHALFSPWTWPFREVVRVRAMHASVDGRSEVQLDPVRTAVMLAGLGGNASRWADALFLMSDELILCEMTRSTRGVDKVRAGSYPPPFNDPWPPPPTLPHQCAVRILFL